MTKLGLRIYRHARIKTKHLEDYRIQQQKFDSFAVKLKEWPEKSNMWYFQHFEIPTDLKKQKEEASHILSRATTSDILIPVPPGCEPLPYQRAGVAYLMGRKATLLADEQGLGKTIQTILYINALNAEAGKRILHRILIICPETLRLNWKMELKKWLIDKSYTVDEVDDIFPDTDIVLIGYCSLFKWTEKLSYYWDLVIVDESDKVSNPKARMTKSLYGYRPTRKEMKEGMQITAGIQTRRKIAITGTPIPNRPKNIWTTAQWLDPVTFRDREHFAFRYFGGCLSERYTDNGSSHEAEFQQLLRSTIMLRRETRDVLKDLPEKRRVIHVLPVTRSVQLQLQVLERTDVMVSLMEKLAKAKAYLELAKCRSMEEYKEALRQVEVVMGGFGAATFELIHQTALAKCDAAAEIIQMAVNDTPKVVIFTHHQDVTDRMLKAFPTALVLDGRVPMDQRHARCVQFQDDPAAGPFIITIVMAVGMNLHAASKGFFVEGSWLPGHISQAEKRIHRIGTRHPVLITHLVLEGSIDLVRAERIIQKQEIVDKMLNLEEDELEREPIFPMPGVTVTRDLIREGAKLYNTTRAISQVSYDCRQLVTNRRAVLKKTDELILDHLLQYGFTDRSCVLGKAVLDAYGGAS